VERLSRRERKHAIIPSTGGWHQPAGHRLANEYLALHLKLYLVTTSRRKLDIFK
jgi:hypothetical protein